MALDIGYRFAPTFDNADALRRRGGGVSGGTAQRQSPLRVLNFQLPQAGGNRLGTFSPLAGQGRRGSQVGSAVLQSVLRTVLGSDAEGLISGGGSSGGSSGGDAGMTGIPGINLGGGGGELDLGALSGFQGGSAPAPTLTPGDTGTRPTAPDFTDDSVIPPGPNRTGLPDYSYQFPWQQPTFSGEA